MKPELKFVLKIDNIPGKFYFTFTIVSVQGKERNTTKIKIDTDVFTFSQPLGAK